MNSLLVSILVFAISLVLIGCGKPDVIVKDETGIPIQGAKVIGMSLSIQGQSSETDKQGEAKIPKAVQKTEWIVVQKEGFFDSEQINVSQPKPILVILKHK
jgi:hypothetical protein